MCLKPPFRDRVARFALGFVGLEDRGDAAHWIGTSLTGAENHGLARWGARFIHPSICWRGGHVQASDDSQDQRPLARANVAFTSSFSLSLRRLGVGFMRRLGCALI